jgi:hypothetical protein
MRVVVVAFIEPNCSARAGPFSEARCSGRILKRLDHEVMIQRLGKLIGKSTDVFLSGDMKLAESSPYCLSRARLRKKHEGILASR